jgi:hypothetical protein
MFQRSWAIVKSSWGVLRLDRELVWLPVISFACTLVTLGLTFGFAWAGGADFGGGSFDPGPLGYVLLFVAYVALAYITIFFNAALISAANERMTGGDPTVASALAGARAKAGRILPWAIISATVSIVLRALSDRSGGLGRLVVGLIGMAWSLVTFLVLPILVLEDITVGPAISRSKDLFKRTWGEQVVGAGAISILAFLAILAGGLVMAVVAATGLTVLIVVAAVALAVWVGGVIAVSSALSGIFQAALYRYASTGHAPTGFRDDELAAAFRPRNQQSRGFGGGFGGFGGGFGGGTGGTGGSNGGFSNN